MKRLLTLVMAVLLCVACAGFASAEVAPTAHHSRTSRTVQSPSAAQLPPIAQIPPALRTTMAATPVSPPGEQLTTVTQAMRAVLPSTKVGFEVYDRQTDTVLTSQNADQPSAAMSVVKLLIALDAVGSGRLRTTRPSRRSTRC